MKKKNNTAYKTEWDFSLLYGKDPDHAVEADIAVCEKAIDAFEKKYRGKTADFAKPEFLAKALSEYETLSTMAELQRPGYYFGLKRELDASNTDAEKKLNLLSDRLTKAGNKILFFDLALAKLPKDAQKKLLSAPILLPYRYHLSQIFENAKHDLTEPEERIMNLKSNVSHSLWVSGTDKMLNKKTVKLGKRIIPIAEAFEMIAKLPKAPRRKLWSECMKVCRSLGEVAENELTAIVLNKKISDEIRKFEKPYSATVLGYENKEKEIEALVAAVTEAFPVSHRFYKLKAKLLREKKLEYADRTTEVGTENKISLEQSVETLRKVFSSAHSEYRAILDRMLMGGQIDVYPKKGKTGGAFCASAEHVPTFVLLNFVPGMRSLMTFAHEMGHAVHAERAKTQRPLYQGHSTATAETASTLFENLVFDAELEHLTKKERIVALHSKISDDISSIMRQVAFFNFEKDMHETIRKEGGMTHTELSAMMRKHLQSYLGPAVNVTEDDGYSYVYISHFRNFFYVYTYAYGNVVSGALADKLKQDSTFIESIDKFLTAGSSASPADIFGAIGLDTLDPDFFKAGIRRLEARIDEFERLIS